MSLCLILSLSEELRFRERYLELLRNWVETNEEVALRFGTRTNAQSPLLAADCVDDGFISVGDPEKETPSLPIYRCFGFLISGTSSSFPRLRSVSITCGRSVCSSNTWYGRPRWLNNAITARFGCSCAASRMEEGSD